MISDLGDILAQNPLAAALFGDVTDRRPEDRNINWQWFTDPSARAVFPAEEHEAISRSHVAHLRATHAARPTDPQVDGLVRRLLAASEEFVELWCHHQVAVRRGGRKTILHPAVGRIELDCEVLAGTGHDQLLLIYTARPGTDSAERLDLLRVLGQQDLSRTEPRFEVT